MNWPVFRRGKLFVSITHKFNPSNYYFMLAHTSVIHVHECIIGHIQIQKSSQVKSLVKSRVLTTESIFKKYGLKVWENTGTGWRRGQKQTDMSHRNIHINHMKKKYTVTALLVGLQLSIWNIFHKMSGNITVSQSPRWHP